MNRILWVLILILINVNVAKAAPVVTFDYTGLQPGDPALTILNLEDDDLKDLTLVELRLMRAGIFARRGHIFDTPWVRAYFKEKPWYKARERVRMEQLSAIEQANVERIDYATNSKSLWQLKAIREGIYAHNRGVMDDTDRIEIELTYEVQQRVQTSEQLYARLNLDDLRKESPLTLSIMRNGIYVSRGRSFQSPVIIRYFKNSQWGYHPNPRYTDAWLTATDWYNIGLIRLVEDEKGGPLQDVERHYPSAGG